MANSTYTAWTKKYKLNILAVLALALIAGGAAWLRYYSPYTPQPLSSSADQRFEPHWAHKSVPFKHTFINNASDPWTSHLKTIVGNWNKADIISLVEKKGNDVNNCAYLIPETINFCSIIDSDAGIAFGGTVYWNDTGHFVAATSVMNDYYLLDPNNPWGNDIYRNKIGCFFMGDIIGARWRFGDNPDSHSCMEALFVDDRVANQQQPDHLDYVNLKDIYSNHQDDPSSSAVAYKVSLANKSFSQKNFGELQRDLSDGNKEVYELDLGDGFRMRTTVVNR